MRVRCIKLPFIYRCCDGVAFYEALVSLFEIINFNNLTGKYFS